MSSTSDLRASIVIVDLIRPESRSLLTRSAGSVPKADGGQRPLGVPTFEDKVLQRAVTTVLEAAYAQGFSAGIVTGIGRALERCTHCVI